MKKYKEYETKGEMASGCANLHFQIRSEDFKINQKMYDAHQCEGVFYDDEDSTKMSFMREEHLYSMKTFDPLLLFYKAVCKYNHTYDYEDL